MQAVLVHHLHAFVRLTRFILSYLDETQRRGFVISHSEKMEFNHNLRKLLIENKVPNAKNVIDQINSLIFDP